MQENVPLAMEKRELLKKYAESVCQRLHNTPKDGTHCFTMRLTDGAFTTQFPPPYVAARSRIVASNGASFILKGAGMTYKQDEAVVANLANILNCMIETLEIHAKAKGEA